MRALAPHRLLPGDAEPREILIDRPLVLWPAPYRVDVLDAQQELAAVMAREQPVEEGGAGAAAMIKDGLMDRFGIEQVYGMHNGPGIPVGSFALRPGPIMAGGDAVVIKIEGRGGHAAQPHKSIDSVLVGAQLITALQSIVSRSVRSSGRAR